MPILPSKVADHGYTKLLERLGDECPDNQFLREFTKNSIQAIQRYIEKSKDKTYKGKIEIDVDWFSFELTGLKKISFVDNGIGMTPNEMIEYCNDLSSSSDIELEEENYGLGAKISAAMKNKLGIKYDSWVNGNGYTVMFLYDQDIKKYGLNQWNEEGDFKYCVPIDDDTKPEIIKDHGTRVTLYGNEEDSDTYDCSYHNVKATKESWVAAYLNKRFLKIPKNIMIKARIGHYRDRENTRHNYMREIIGLENTLNKFTVKDGRVDLDDAAVYWRIMKPEREGHAREYVTGHTAVIHENEVFDISYGVGNKALGFGIYVGAPNIALHIHPKTSEYMQNNVRNNIILKGTGSLPWERWQNQFQNNFPAELSKYLEDTMSMISDEDSNDKIRDRLKDYAKDYAVSKYKRSKTGKYLVDEADLHDGYVGGYTDGPGSYKKSSKPRSGNISGKLQALISLQISDDGKVPADKAKPDPYPEVKWINPEDHKDLFDPTELTDRAALYREEQHLVFANQTYSGFLDAQEKYTKEFSGLPVKNIVAVVREVFEQQLMETIAGAIYLKNRKHWEPSHYETAISPECLTVSVAARYHFYQFINRRLSQLAKDTNKQKDTVEV